jgi:hypothetical protein
VTTATALPPLPPPTTQISSANGQIAQGYAQYLQQADNTLRTALTEAGGATLIGGFNEQPFSLGTPAAGSTITPNPSDNLKQTLTNNAAFTIAATSQVGDVELYITNGATAGAITFGGFTKNWTGDSLVCGPVPRRQRRHRPISRHRRGFFWHVQFRSGRAQPHDCRHCGMRRNRSLHGLQRRRYQRDAD